MRRISLSFKETVRDLLLYEFLQEMKETRSPSQYVKDLVEADKNYIEWRNQNG